MDSLERLVPDRLAAPDATGLATLALHLAREVAAKHLRRGASSTEWMRLASTFLVVGGAFGLFFALATPPHDPPDEARHHARVWLMSVGRLGVVGRRAGTLSERPARHPTPAFVRPSLQRRAAELGPATSLHPAHPQTRMVGPALGPARFACPLRPPARLLPQRVSAQRLRALRARALAGERAGSVGRGGAAAGAPVRARALARGNPRPRIAPAQRWLLCAGRCFRFRCPSRFASRGSAHEVAIFWFLAECLRAGSRAAGALRGADVARLLAAALALGLVKPGYAPLALACLALPLRAGTRLTLAAGALAAAVVPALGWAAIASAAAAPPVVSGADLAGQLRYSLAHPLAFLAAAANTVAALVRRWSRAW